MAETTTRPTPEPGFTPFAGRQLLMWALASLAGVTLLMVALSWASSLTGATAGSIVAVDPATKTIPLDATLVRGSHGAPVGDDRQRGVLLASRQGACRRDVLCDIDVAEVVLRNFGMGVGSRE